MNFRWLEYDALKYIETARQTCSTATSKTMQNAQNVTVIGDVHGCLPTLEALLSQIPEDVPLIFIGDLINRGPESLKTLRCVVEMGDRAHLILGNHEMHLLASAAGAGKVNRRDTIEEILNAPDADDLVDWVRHQHLLLQWRQFTFVHAALDPAWSVKEAVKLAHEVQSELRSKQWKTYLKEMYGKDLWDKSLTGSARMRAILNGFTRIRFVDKKGIPDYKVKDAPGINPPHLMPWFECPARKNNKNTIVFGHWSTLGFVNTPYAIALDTGCVWGGALSALILPERRLIQVKAPQYCDPFA